MAILSFDLPQKKKLLDFGDDEPFLLKGVSAGIEAGTVDPAQEKSYYEIGLPSWYGFDEQAPERENIAKISKKSTFGKAISAYNRWTKTNPIGKTLTDEDKMNTVQDVASVTLLGAMGLSAIQQVVNTPQFKMGVNRIISSPLSQRIFGQKVSSTQMSSLFMKLQPGGKERFGDLTKGESKIWSAWQNAGKHLSQNLARKHGLTISPGRGAEIVFPKSLGIPSPAKVGGSGILNFYGGLPAPVKAGDMVKFGSKAYHVMGMQGTTAIISNLAGKVRKAPIKKLKIIETSDKIVEEVGKFLGGRAAQGKVKPGGVSIESKKAQAGELLDFLSSHTGNYMTETDEGQKSIIVGGLPAPFSGQGGKKALSKPLDAFVSGKKLSSTQKKKVDELLSDWKQFTEPLRGTGIVKEVATPVSQPEKIKPLKLDFMGEVKTPVTTDERKLLKFKLQQQKKGSILGEKSGKESVLKKIEEKELKEKEMGIVKISEIKLIKFRLQQQAKGVRVGYKEGSKVARNNILMKLKSSKIEVADIKQDLFNYANEHLLPSDRGKLLARMKNVHTRKGLARAHAFTDSVADRRFRRDSIADLNKTVSNINVKELRPEFKKEVQGLLADINLKGISSKRQWKLENTLKYIQENPDNNIPPEKLAALQRLSRRDIDSLNAEEIVLLNDTLKHFASLNKLKNKYIFGGKAKESVEVNKEATANVRTKNLNTKTLEQIGFSRKSKEPGDIKKFFGIKSWNAETVTDILDGKNKGIIHKVVYEGFNEGYSKSLDIKHKAEDFFTQKMVEAGLNPKDLVPWSEHFNTNIKKVDYQVINLPDAKKPIKLSKGERIAFFLHSLNDKNLSHLLNGGFSFERDNFVINKLTSDDLGAIINSMTPEEMEMAGMMHEYLNTIQKDYINEASVELNGFEIATENDYFRIRTNPLDLKRDALKLRRHFTHATLEGLGMFKQRTNSKNAIIIEDAFSVVRRGIEQSSAYAGYANPLRNAKQLLGDTGFRQAVALHHGKHYLEYLDRFVKDMEVMAYDIPSLDRLALHLINKIDPALLGANPGVIAKQPVSWLFASTEIDMGYLLKAAGSPADKALMAKYSPEIRDRLHGKMSREIGEVGSIGETRRFWTGKTTMSQKWMKGIQRGDYESIGRIWKASELEVRDKFPELTGDEFYNKVARRTEEIVRLTQPTFAPKDRAEISRDISGLTRVATKYMSQRNKNLNMCVRANAEYQRSGKTAKDKAKFAKKVFMVLIAGSAAINRIDRTRRWLTGKTQPESESKDFVLGTMKNIIGNSYILGDIVNSLDSKISRGTFAGFDVSNVIYSTADLSIDAIAETIRTIDQVISGEEYKGGKQYGEEKWKVSMARAIDKTLEATSRYVAFPYGPVKRWLGAPFIEREDEKTAGELSF